MPKAGDVMWMNGLLGWVQVQGFYTPEFSLDFNVGKTSVVVPFLLAVFTKLFHIKNSLTFSLYGSFSPHSTPLSITSTNSLNIN